MGTAAPKPRPMRSRRSGLKKMRLISQNIQIIKKLESSLKEKKIK
jgi:hypothetical protein